MPQRLELTPDTYLLVLTGAGVSAESGVPTFRGLGGLWETQPVERVASPAGFAADPALVWRFYSTRRAAALRCEPNAGHRALATVERRLGQRFLLVTQNVDGLHRRAGSQRLVELHGDLFKTRCFSCDREPFHDERSYPEGEVPRCDRCAAGLLRPAVVWFGEVLEPAHLEQIGDFLFEGARRGRLVFLAVGTSGAVYPAAGLVNDARRLGAEAWLVNADPADNAAAFDHFLQGRSAELLPTLLGE